MRTISLLTILMLTCSCINATANDATIMALTVDNGDSSFIPVSADTAATVTTQKPGFLKKIMNYFSKDNSGMNGKKFKLSIIGGPHYSSDTKFGIGLVGSGFFRVANSDTTIQPSNVTMYGDVSTSSFALVGLRGNTLLHNDAQRINYNLSFYYMPTYVWGIGYDNCDNDNNKSKMNFRHIGLNLEYLFRLTKGLYAGAVANWQYVKASDFDRPDLIANQDLTIKSYGFGVTLEYDTRALITNAYKGVYVQLRQIFHPKWLWNEYAYSTTEFTANVYHKVWKGGIIATQLYTKFNFGNPSWATMSQLGETGSMRGYYAGRYRDKHIMTALVELRQHVWRRNGIAVWLGAASVFHNAGSLNHLLPNCGIGYRWEFKDRMNVRLDFGMGKKGQNAFIFNINEAF